eukprot:jgi/Hompol1/3299/HPOL_003191-RA
MLQDLEPLSEYTIEYASALMMNLCLRTLGKQECSEHPQQTLKILNELIEHDNVQVKTYANGTLYSVLSEKAVRECARSIGMEEQLSYLRQVSDEQLVKQIDFVIERLNSEEDQSSDDVSEDGDEDDTVDDDEDQQFFDEEDSRDITPNDANELIEEELLEAFAINKLKAIVQEATRPKSSKKPTPNVPKTRAEKEEFDLAFLTRPKLSRTPMTLSSEDINGGHSGSTSRQSHHMY